MLSKGSKSRCECGFLRGVGRAVQGEEEGAQDHGGRKVLVQLPPGDQVLVHVPPGTMFLLARQ